LENLWRIIEPHCTNFIQLWSNSCSCVVCRKVSVFQRHLLSAILFRYEEGSSRFLRSSIFLMKYMALCLRRLWS
jgi:hypothetical protein